MIAVEAGRTGSRSSWPVRRQRRQQGSRSPRPFPLPSDLHLNPGPARAQQCLLVVDCWLRRDDSGPADLRPAVRLRTSRIGVTHGALDVARLTEARFSLDGDSKGTLQIPKPDAKCTASRCAHAVRRGSATEAWALVRGSLSTIAFCTSRPMTAPSEPRTGTVSRMSPGASFSAACSLSIAGTETSAALNACSSSYHRRLAQQTQR